MFKIDNILLAIFVILKFENVTVLGNESFVNNVEITGHLFEIHILHLYDLHTIIYANEQTRYNYDR